MPVERGPTQEEEILDEDMEGEVEDDSEVRDACSQELFSTPEEASQSQLLELGEAQTGEEAPGTVDTIRCYWPPGAMPECSLVTALDNTLNSDALASTGDHQHSPPSQATMQSPPSQETTQSRIRRRAPAWSEWKVLDLIVCWGDESVMAELHSKKRNTNAYAKVSRAMTERGYSRDTEQCRTKIKELRQVYQKAKEVNRHSRS
ncbi:Putative protein C11orf61 like protein [Chelonia mydas]|uniref:Myb/SANT-like DNA-binding domain-containing protein n=1 Tax=Chelonia mydas TaxID=8469 RepID=M7BU20_CHEMY|nr:Putative protein C11orf61 like protein [Chelonia mydas]